MYKGDRNYMFRGSKSQGFEVQCSSDLLADIEVI